MSLAFRPAMDLADRRIVSPTKIQKLFAACAPPGQSSLASSTCTRALLAQQTTTLISGARRTRIGLGTHRVGQVADREQRWLLDYAARPLDPIPAGPFAYQHLIVGLSDSSPATAL